MSIVKVQQAQSDPILATLRSLELNEQTCSRRGPRKVHVLIDNEQRNELNHAMN